VLSQSRDTETDRSLKEPKPTYRQKILSEVERIFEIIEEQREY